MIQPGELRFFRTSALGRMPGFAPAAPPVGPWRPVRLIGRHRPQLLRRDIRTRVADGVGHIAIALWFREPPTTTPRCVCGGEDIPLRAQTPTHFIGAHTIEQPEFWFPHTHGAPHLYDVIVSADDEHCTERVGFRTITVDRGADGDGFTFCVNGAPLFARGAVWTPLDPMSLQNNADALRRQIALARAAGVNMFRVAGPFVYEDDAFYRACDSAGVMIWQDFMFANFDYPTDATFLAAVNAETRAFLRRVGSAPSLAVLCGGSEVYQQAAMMGLPETRYRARLFDDLLPRIASEERQDVPYVVNSPSGGALPFHVDNGVSHYYGVGAYRRPLEDARRANVRFASECLGFANVPDTRTTLEDFGPLPLSSPLWRPRIPRDQGAAQDFEEVRDHYIALLYDVDPLALKTTDPQRYLDLSRAAVAETIEATVGEWRGRSAMGQGPGGALIWFWKDLWASTGWGIVDWRGRPKSAWHGARRAFRPIQLILSDEGVNGLHIHCFNERNAPFEGMVELTCYANGATVVMRATAEVTLPARGAITLRDSALWGAFFDTSFAYRFGPAAHAVTHAALRDAGGAGVAESWHFPLGRSAALFAPAITVTPFRDAEGCGLTLVADRFAQSVKIEEQRAIALDNWFHLAPNAPQRVRFLDDEAGIEGCVAALGGPSAPYRL